MRMCVENNPIAAEVAERNTRNLKVDVWRAFLSRFGMVEKEWSKLCLFQAFKEWTLPSYWVERNTD